MKKQVVITAEIRKAINRYPSGSQDGKCGEAKVIARLFYPKGDNAFYILEGGQEPGQVWDGDNVYGLCRHDGCEFEYGSFSLKEMLATKAKIEWTYGTMEVGIERDILVDPLKKTIRECMTANSEPLPAYWEDDAKPEAPAPVKEEPKPVKAKCGGKCGEFPGCRGCVHCIDDKDGESETGKLCDICAPVLYSIISKQDLDGKGPQNNQAGKLCKHYKPRTDDATPAPVFPKEIKDKDTAIQAIAAAHAANEQAHKPRKPRAKKPTTPAVEAKPKAVTDGPTPGGWEPELWRKMTDRNDHNGVRMAVSNWATANATAEVEEFSLLAQDFAYIASEGADSMTPELLDFRLELDAELEERVKRVYGADKWAQVAACL